MRSFHSVNSSTPRPFAIPRGFWVASPPFTLITGTSFVETSEFSSWDLFNHCFEKKKLQSLVIALSTLRSNMFSTRNLSKHQLPRSTKCGTLLNDFRMGSGWWVRCLFSVYNKTWRNRFPPCAQCGLENKVRYCPMISIHLQNLCCNSAWMVISRFVQITYSFTVETTCSCKKCSCILPLWNKHDDAEYQAVFEPKDSKNGIIPSIQSANSVQSAKSCKAEFWCLLSVFGKKTKFS